MSQQALVTEITMDGLPFHLDIAFETKNPMFLHGPPGVGKSSGIYAFCEKKFNDGVFKSPEPIDIRLGNHDITDFKFPFVDREKEIVKWLVANIFPVESRDGSAGVLFLDELSSAPPQIQTLAYAILQDRKIPSTDYKLPPGWIVVAAGNRESDQAVVHKLSSALCNRVNHLNIKPDWTSFKAWGERNNIHPLVLQFLEARHAEYLYKYTRGEKAYPTPRSWSNASDALKVLIKLGCPMFRIQEQMVSWLGGEVGSSFTSFVDTFDKLPQAKDILEGKAPLPPINEIDKLFFIGQTIASEVQKNPSKYAKAYLKLLITDLNEEIAVDSLRRTLSDDRSKTKVVEAFRKEASMFKQVVTKYSTALAQLGLES